MAILQLLSLFSLHFRFVSELVSVVPRFSAGVGINSQHDALPSCYLHANTHSKELPYVNDIYRFLCGSATDMESVALVIGLGAPHPLGLSVYVQMPFFHPANKAMLADSVTQSIIGTR